jgi:hypothetical protein
MLVLTLTPAPFGDQGLGKVLHDYRHPPPEQTRPQK